MLLALVVSAVLAVCLIEAVYALIDTGWLTARLIKLKASLAAFQRAGEDADRQRIITRAGLLTCWMSVVTAAFMLTLFGLILLPVYLIQWTSDIDQMYFAALTMFSLVWLLFRRKVLKA